MKALIFNDIVLQIEETDFPVAEGLRWVDIPQGAEVKEKYTYKDSSFNEPIVPEIKPTDKEMIDILLDSLVNVVLGTIEKKELEKTYADYKEGLSATINES